MTRATLVVGDTDAAHLLCASLARSGMRVTHLLGPGDDELVAALGPDLDPDLDAVAVVVRGDIAALRYALLIEHARPGVRLIVTVFDRTVAHQLRIAVPGCQVTSPADIAVPSIAAACLGDDLLAVAARGHKPHLIRVDGRLLPLASSLASPRNHRFILAGTVRRFRAHDTTAKVMLAGAAGLVSVLALDWSMVTLLLHESPARALYNAVRVVATVGPADTGDHSPTWYLVLASALMVLTIGFTALLTAGLVNRLLSTRSIAILGRRTMPTRDHVVVIGLGQVGLRLCVALRRLGVRVVAVERDPGAVNLRLAKAAGVPVLLAHAEDRATLKRVSADRARALAAMGSDELDNIEAAIAALAVAPELRIVLRAGDDTVVAETTSLFRIGDVRDVAALTACAVARGVLGLPAGVVVGRGQDVRALDPDDGHDLPGPDLSPAQSCPHRAASLPARDTARPGEPTR